MKDVLEAAGKSLWKEVRDLAVKKGTETFVAEGVKSVIEIVKRRRIRRDEYEFAEWKKAQKPDGDDDEKSESEDKKANAKKSDKSEDDASEADAEDGEAEADADAPAPEEPAKPDEPEDSEDPES